MANLTFADLEDKVLAALHPLERGEVGGYLRTLKGYQGELDVETADEISVQWPAAFVWMAGATFTPESTRLLDYQTRPEVQVFVGDQNWRGEREGRRGGPAGTSEIGTYKMAEDVLTALAGKTFGLAIGRLVPKERRAVVASLRPPVSIYRLTFEFSDVPYVDTGD